MNNIQDFVDAIKDISIHDFAYGSGSWIIMREPLEPHKGHLIASSQLVEENYIDTTGRSFIRATYKLYLSDYKTGEKKEVTLNDAAAAVRGYVNPNTNRFKFVTLMTVVADDTYLKYQLIDKLCRLADKYLVDIEVHLSAISNPKNKETQQETAHRLVKYHDFRKSRGYLYIRQANQ